MAAEARRVAPIRRSVRGGFPRWAAPALLALPAALAALLFAFALPDSWLEGAPRAGREEGIFAGNSAGSAMAGLLQLRENFTKDDVVVVIFHDHGSRYLGKMFNDDWMREKGFLEKTGMTARDLVEARVSGELLAIEGSEPLETAVGTIVAR